MSISGITNNDSSFADAVGGAQMGKEAFMELLVQQLKNQDPLSPMDNDKFVAQLTQLSSLEGIQNLNENVVSLAMLQQSNALMSQLTQAAALIGGEVTYIDMETGEELTGVVQSVKIEDGFVALNIDGEDVPLFSITEVTGGDSAGDGDTDAGDESDEGTED